MYSERDFVALAEWRNHVGLFGTLSGHVYSNFPENLRVSMMVFSCNNLHHSRSFVYLVLAALR